MSKFTFLAFWFFPCLHYFVNFSANFNSNIKCLYIFQQLWEWAVGKCPQLYFRMLQRLRNEGIKYTCSKCDYQAFSKGNLAQHQRGLHKRIIKQLKRTSSSISKGSAWRSQILLHAMQPPYNFSLVQHQKAVQKWVKYPCGQWNYQATQRRPSTLKGSAKMRQILL